jgi:hypothetical protein
MIMKKSEIEQKFDDRICWLNTLYLELTDSPEDEVQKEIYLELTTKLDQSKADFIEMYDEVKQEKEKEDLD